MIIKNPDPWPGELGPYSLAWLAMLAMTSSPVGASFN